MTKIIIIFLLTQIFIAGLFWVGGFNFDHRTPEVAWGILFTVLVGAALTAVITTLEDE